jgi:hypothetical protein
MTHRNTAPWATGACVFVAGLSLLLPLAPDAHVSGDAVVYGRQIASHDFSQHTIHLGYLLIGSVFSFLSPLPVDYTLNLANGVMGALSAVLAFSIAFSLLGRLLPAAAAAVLLLVNSLFAFQSACAEVYVPQVLFILLALQLMLLDRPVPAALAFAMSFLITPAALFSAPLFLIRRQSFRSLTFFALVFMAILVPALSPRLADYLFSVRGVFRISAFHLPMPARLLKEATELIQGFGPGLFFVAAGCVQMAIDRRFHRVAVAIALLWLSVFLFCEKALDVPSQLTFYAVLCIVGAIGFDDLIRRANPLLVSLLFVLCASIAGYSAVAKVVPISREAETYRDTVLQAAPLARPDYIIIGSAPRGLIFEHYALNTAFAGRWLNPKWLTGTRYAAARDDAIKQWNNVLSSAPDLWLVDQKPDPNIVSALMKRGYSITPFHDIYRASQ